MLLLLGALLGLIYWVFLLPIFGMYLSTQKGRGMLEGLMFGLLLGPLGCLLLVWLPTLPTAKPSKLRRVPSINMEAVVHHLNSI